jgi:hypothetical protein
MAIDLVNEYIRFDWYYKKHNQARESKEGEKILNNLEKSFSV